MLVNKSPYKNQKMLEDYCPNNNKDMRTRNSQNKEKEEKMTAKYDDKKNKNNDNAENHPVVGNPQQRVK